MVIVLPGDEIYLHVFGKDVEWVMCCIGICM